MSNLGHAQDVLVAEAWHRGARHESLRVVDLHVDITLHLGAGPANLAEGAQAWPDGAEGQLPRGQLVTSVAVAAGDAPGIVAELHADPALGDLLSLAPVAHQAAVGRELHAGHAGLRDALGHAHGNGAIGGPPAARRLGFVLIEAVETGLAARLERFLHDLHGPLRLRLGVAAGGGTHHRGHDRAGHQPARTPPGGHRLMAGALKTPPLALRARNMVSAIEASEPNSSAGKRCWRKQSK